MTLKSTKTQATPSAPQSSAWKPHAYQAKAIKFLLQNACAGLLLRPGLGKTSITLAVLKILKKKGMFNKALIIAPLRPVYNVWPAEIKKWRDFHDLTYAILHGPQKDKRVKEDVDICFINPEGLPWLLKDGVAGLKKHGFDMLVIDESTKFKKTNTQRFKLLRPMLGYFRRRYILTGSFNPNGLMDAFGQIYIVDGGNALGQYITHYRNKYFFPTGYGGYEWKLQPGAEAKIQDAIRPITMSMVAEDYLDLPKVITSRVEVELPNTARQTYLEMEGELFARLAKGDIVAINAAVASSKCRQIANGGIYDEDGKSHFIHNAKAEAVLDIVEELNGSPALVAYEFEHDLTRLRDVVGKKTPHIGGGVSSKRTMEIIKEWNDGSLPVLLGQPASMAHGLNLQDAGNQIIWHSLPWNYEYYDQFNLRVVRQGNKNAKAFVHHIIARDTIDDLILTTLEQKGSTQKNMFDALKVFFKGRQPAKGKKK